MLKHALITAFATALASPASAVVLNYTTTGAGALTFFPGTVQQTVLTAKGCPEGFFRCQTAPDLTLGVATDVFSHFLEITAPGINDGSFPGPNGSFSAPIVFNFGSQSVTLGQQIALRQIGNNQFQTDYSGGSTATVDVAGVGRVRLELLGNALQFQGGGSGGAGTLLLTRFTLESAIPEPASWALMIAGFGLAGGALRARAIRRLTI